MSPPGAGATPFAQRDPFRNARRKRLAPACTAGLHLLAAFWLGQQRRAGRIDKELRGGKSGVPKEAGTPRARFQRGVEAAHVERSMSMIEDSYTSPDGILIYRRRIGGRTVCRQTGSVGLGVAGTRLGGDPGLVACPSGVTWSRLE